ncbi:response regulator [Polaromonas sp.]|jgi:two-component system response regulator|uniref:response regulator n=1 Tax=Polaromonas sp. TaxID=1869339 RepID=UPI001E04E510|nr:response regulator [Polaromonas sp.]MBT9474363.1 response regulator [Polaromonas sp.]
MRKPTILVVEDNPDHLELTLTTLQQHGLPHAIVVVHDGLEALDYLFCEGLFCDRDPDPDHQPYLVLLDLGLPKLSGLAVMQRMRDDPRTFFIPVIMLTSASEQSQAVIAFKGGLNSYVSKPLDYYVFEEKLQQLNEIWRTSDLAPLGNN